MKKRPHNHQPDSQNSAEESNLIHKLQSWNLHDLNIVFSQQLPVPVSDIESLVSEVLEASTSATPLSSCVVPGDKVTLAVDPQTPCLQKIIPPIIRILVNSQIELQDITILFSLQGKYTSQVPSPAEELETHLHTEFPQLEIMEHQPVPEEKLKYLASTAMSAPVMLHEKLVDADVVIPVGLACYDRFYGTRNGNSVLYPGFSTSNDLQKGLRHGHVELASGEDFPLKQLADEVGWLLGSIMTLQIIPATATAISAAYWGPINSVSKTTEQILSSIWKIPVSQRVETVIAQFPTSSLSNATEALVESLAKCRQLVKRGGRIVFLSDIAEIHDDLSQLIQGNLKPSELYQLWGKDFHHDPWKVIARSLMETVDWCHVYLESRLPDQQVQNLMLHPLKMEDEALKQKIQSSGDIISLQNPLYISSLQTN